MSRLEMLRGPASRSCIASEYFARCLLPRAVKNLRYSASLPCDINMSDEQKKKQ